MYLTHAVNCQQYSQRNANNLADVVLLVVLSIQQNWLSVGDQLADVRKNGHESKFLWGNKQLTYRYLMCNKHKMFAQIKAVLNSNKNRDDKAYSLMKIFLRVDGLGLPKAGFCCQLVGGLVGCMDVHNIKMYNIDSKSLKLNSSPKTEVARATNEKKIKDYISLCHSYGCGNLWNSWCEFIALKSKKWQDANHVSEVHYTYLTGDYSND